MFEPAVFGLSRRRLGNKSSRRGFQMREAAAYVEQLEPRWLLTVPAVTSVTPFGVTGATVTVNGSGFTGATAVDFWLQGTSNNTAGSYSVVNDTKLTVTVPSLAQGHYYIEVTTSGGTSQQDANSLFADVAPAVVAATQFTSSFTLNSGVIPDISVISTADFAPSGSLFVETTTGVATISYANKDDTTFKTCTVVTTDPFNVGATDSTGTLNTTYPAVFQATNKTYTVDVKDLTNLPAGAQNAISYAMYWGSTGGTFYYLNGGKYSPIPGSGSLPTYAIASGGTTISLPYMPINSARIYFGVGTAPNLTVSGSGIATPAPGSTNSVYDFIEGTLDASGADNSVPLAKRFLPTLNINTSQVDQFGMPITLTGMNNNNGTPTLTSLGVTLSDHVARNAIFAEFKTLHPNDAYSSLVIPSSDPNQPLRIENPGKVSIQNSMALGYVFDSVINTLFQTSGLQLTVGTNTYTSSVQNVSGYKVLQFSGSGISAPVNVYEPFFSSNAPASASLSPSPGSYTGALAAPSWLANASETPGQMVFGNDGVFDDAINANVAHQQPGLDSGQRTVLAAIENQLVAALNRGVALLPVSEWQDPSKYYNQPFEASNAYAAFLHNQTINGTQIFIDKRAYAIAYDDQGNQNPSLVLLNQDSITVSLGPWQTATLPNSDANFLTSVYQSVLNRAVDSAGSSFWLGLLANGVSRVEVSQGIADSIEAHTDFINDLYLNLLNRPADAQGLNEYLNLFAAGQTAAQVRSIFYGSNEYFQQFQTISVGGQTFTQNSNWVDAVFQKVLYRLPNSTEQAYYDGLLASGDSRAYVVSVIVGSLEANQNTVRQYYVWYLYRVAGSTGVDFWTPLLQQDGHDSVIQANVLGSEEYYLRV